MVKALFYVEGKKMPVQHIGCRMIITREMILAGFKKGGAFNLPDGRVEVILDGSKEEIDDFYNKVKENLFDWLIASAKDKNKLKENLGNPGIRVSDLEFNENLLVLDIGLFSHALTFDQIYKGVDVYQDLTIAIKNLNLTLEKQI